MVSSMDDHNLSSDSSVQPIIPVVQNKSGPEMASIPELVSTALTKFSSLEHAAEAENPSSAKTLRWHLSRFKLWAGGTGAYRPYGHGSLEYHLSGALTIRDHVVALLMDMTSHLEEGRQLPLLTPIMVSLYGFFLTFASRNCRSKK